MPQETPEKTYLDIAYLLSSAQSSLFAHMTQAKFNGVFPNIGTNVPVARVRLGRGGFQPRGRIGNVGERHRVE